ncbi:SOS response-associated peptidase [Rothia nasimurium]|uniref:SOS response-associated peptidase n=1 Tax=Rothia nasimurium TaxID=85336 RepID=UPI003BA071B7
MCGRYVLELAMEHPQYLAGVEVDEPVINYNVAPTATVPILVDRLLGPDEVLQDGATPQGAQGGLVTGDGTSSPVFTRELHSARWGLLPGWAKDPSYSSRAFNARSETIFEKPTFREAAVSGHCAIPVSGYYEWKTESTAAGKTVKTPYFVHRSDGRPIYFAGLYEWWKIPAEFAGPDGPFPGQGGNWLLSCSIITMDSPGNGEFDPGILADLGEQVYAHPVERDLGQLHDRLPIPLQVSDDTSNNPADTLTSWLRSGCPAGSPKPGNDPAGRQLKGAYRAGAAASLENIRNQAFPQTHSWQLTPAHRDVGNVRNNGRYLIEAETDLLTGFKL